MQFDPLLSEHERCGNTSKPDASFTCYSCTMPKGHTGLHHNLSEDLRGAMVWSEGQVANFEPGPLYPRKT